MYILHSFIQAGFVPLIHSSHSLVVLLTHVYPEEI